jgi:hypothetical protein
LLVGGTGGAPVMLAITGIRILAGGNTSGGSNWFIYGWAVNVSTTATATSTPLATAANTTVLGITNGGFLAGHGADQAVDGLDSTTYFESGMTTGLAGVCGLQTVWGSTQPVASFHLAQDSLNPLNKVMSVSIYTTANGSTWTLQGTYTLPGTGYGLMDIPLTVNGDGGAPVTVNCQGLRMLAGGNTVGNANWIIFGFQVAITTVGATTPNVWVPVTRLFLGQCATNGTGVTGSTSYALRGAFYTDRIAAAANSTVAVAHNLGTSLVEVRAGVASQAGGPLSQATWSALDPLTTSFATASNTVEASLAVTRLF